jgi:hypothetical protein
MEHFGGTGRRALGVLAGSTLARFLVALPAAASSSHTLRGTVALSLDHTWPADQGTCAGPTGAYQDLEAGAQVRVTDGRGRVLGVGRLGAGTVDEVVDHKTFGACVFPFRVNKVPVRSVYRVQIEGHPASIYALPDPSFPDQAYAAERTTLADMRRAKWVRELALGFVPVGARLAPS